MNISKAQYTGSEFRVVQVEEIARKLASIRNHEYPKILQQITREPRLIELLLWLQFVSMQPGGFMKFTEDLLAEFPEQLGTPTMTAACKVRGYTIEQRMAIILELPHCLRPSLPDSCWEDYQILGDYLRPLDKMDARERRDLAAATNDFDQDFFREICREAALKNLPQFLIALCTQPGTGFKVEATDRVWYLQDTIGTLLQMMTRWEAREKGRIAYTAVTSLIFESFDRLIATQEAGIIRGNSRFGKTESLKAYCAGRPGRVRFVAVPSSNSMRDFLVRIAEALGIDTTYGCSVASLRSKMTYIFRHTGLSLALDEGAWLLPVSYSATTEPHRLNWIRSELIDRDIAVVIAVTPQWYDESLKKFLKTTNFVIEQFVGRCETIALPDGLSEEDLIKVAAVHFPEINSRGALKIIGSRADRNRHSSYLKAIGLLEKRARYDAQRTGKPLSWNIVFALIEKLFPNSGEVHSSEPESEPMDKPLLNPVSRAVKPAEMGTNFPSCSLRGAGLDRTKADLVSAES